MELIEEESVSSKSSVESEIVTLSPEHLIIKSAASTNEKSQKKLHKKAIKILNKPKKTLKEKVAKNVNELENLLHEIEENRKSLLPIAPPSTPEKQTEFVDSEAVKETQSPGDESVAPTSEDVKETVSPGDESVAPKSEEVKETVSPGDEVSKTEEVKTEDVKDMQSPDTESDKLEETASSDAITVGAVVNKVEEISKATTKTINKMKSSQNVEEVMSTKCSDLNFNKIVDLIKKIFIKGKTTSVDKDNTPATSVAV